MSVVFELLAGQGCFFQLTDLALHVLAVLHFDLVLQGQFQVLLPVKLVKELLFFLLLLAELVLLLLHLLQLGVDLVELAVFRG